MAEHSRDATMEAGQPDEERGQEKGFDDVRDMKPHQSVGFWHHSMNKVRRHVIQLWARTGELQSRAVICRSSALQHGGQLATAPSIDTAVQLSFYSLPS